jgi:hypothetical protein
MRTLCTPLHRALRAAILTSSLFVLAGLMAPGLVHAQTFSVSDPTTSADGSVYYWTPFTVAGSGGVKMSDPTIDQQTGQTADDLVGSATTPGFFIRFGQINGVDSVAFRLMENKLYTQGGNTNFTGQVSVGLDTDGDGGLDIVLTAIGKNSNNGINYQAPGTGLNNSPSTTSLANPVLMSAFTSSNFDYQAVNSTLYPNWTQIGSDPDASLTFALSFASLNNALTTLGESTITTSTLLRFIAFTSTQTNAINQDLYGPNGITDATTFSASGAFTEFTDITGRPVPELPTAVLTGGLLGVGLLFRQREKFRDLIAWFSRKEAAVSNR